MPKRFIPIQNVIIGFISRFVCYFANIETNLFNSIVVCFVASQAAGISNLFQSNKDDTIPVVSDSAEVYNEVENNKDE